MNEQKEPNEVGWWEDSPFERLHVHLVRGGKIPSRGPQDIHWEIWTNITFSRGFHEIETLIEKNGPLGAFRWLERGLSQILELALWGIFNPELGRTNEQNFPIRLTMGQGRAKRYRQEMLAHLRTRAIFDKTGDIARIVAAFELTGESEQSIARGPSGVPAIPWTGRKIDLVRLAVELAPFLACSRTDFLRHFVDKFGKPFKGDEGSLLSNAKPAALPQGFATLVKAIQPESDA